MTRCKHCGVEIIRFSDRWAHVGDEGVLFSWCRATRAEPEEVGFSGGIPHKGYIEITTVRGDRLLVHANNILRDGVQVDLARRRVTVEFAATGVRLLKREEVEGSDRPD